MNRNLTLQEKKEKLLSNSFHTLNQNITSGNQQISRDRYEGFREDITALMEYFEHHRVYVVDLPANIIPHPENRRRRVDPELANTPTTKTLVVNSWRFDNLYLLTEKFNQLLDENKEIFVYVIETVQFYDPMNFEPTYRYMVRFGTIDLDYWYNPEYREEINEPVQPEQYFERYARNRVENNVEESKPMSVGKSILKHKF
jgi:hypothetical protein